MKGSMRERRPGVWELIVQLPRNPVSGRTQQLSRTVEGTKREAQRRLAALVAEVSSGKVASSTATLDELIGRWLEARSERLSPTTAREYRRLHRVLISPAVGSVPIRKLTPQRLDAFYAALGHDRGLAPSSVRQIHAVIRGSLNQAAKWGWVTDNPAVRASPPATRRSEIDPPSVDTVKRLLAEADEWNAEFGVILRVIVATGARRGEVCALRWCDVDRAAGSLVIRHSIAKAEDGLREKGTKTHASRRIAIDEHTVKLFEGHRNEAQERAAACRVAVPADGYVFSPEPDGSLPLAPDLVTGRFRALCRRLGICGVRLHDLRHVHATQLLAAGVPVRTVSGRLGHANAATTLNVYAHFLEASDRAAADVVSGLFGADTG